MATDARLTAGFWVAAYLTRLRLSNIPAYVTAKGDATAGAVEPAQKLNVVRCDNDDVASLVERFQRRSRRRHTLDCVCAAKEFVQNE